MPRPFPLAQARPLLSRGLLALALLGACGTPPAPHEVAVEVSAPPAAATTPCDRERSTALALLAEGHTERALEATEEFLAHCPQEAPRIWSTRVIALADLERRSEALALADRIDSSPQADPEARRAAQAARLPPTDLPASPDRDLDRSRGEALEEEGYAERDPARALDLFLASCRLRARCPHARVGAALALRALGQKARARRVLARTLALVETSKTPVQAMATVGLPSVGALIASPTSHRWALVSDSEVSLLHGSTLGILRRAEVPQRLPPKEREGDSVCLDRCRAAAFSPDGRLIAWAGPYSAVGLWDATGEGGPPTRLADTPAHNPFSVEFSPDGRLLAASLPEGIGLWDTATRARLRVLPGATPIAFSADSTRLTTSRGVFETASGKAIQTFHLGAGRTTILLGPHGQWMISAEDWHIKAQFHDLSGRSRAPRSILRGLDLFRAIPSPEGHSMLTIPRGGPPLHLWDLDADQELLAWNPGLSSVEEGLFSPSGRLLALWGSLPMAEIWETRTRSSLHTFRTIEQEKAQRNQYIYAAAFSTDEQLLLTSMKNPGGVQVWDLTSGARLAHSLYDEWSHQRNQKEHDVSGLTIEPGPRVLQDKKVLFDPASAHSSLTFLERNNQFFATLRGLEGIRAGYVILSDGRVEIVGPDAALAEPYLSCQIGTEIYPFALCEERLRATHLLTPTAAP